MDKHLKLSLSDGVHHCPLPLHLSDFIVGDVILTGITLCNFRGICQCYITLYEVRRMMKTMPFFRYNGRPISSVSNFVFLPFCVLICMMYGFQAPVG